MISSASERWPVSAYIPCYNNAGTIGLAIQAMRNQTYPLDELFVVDDGSSDTSVKVVEDLGVRVVSMGKNQGRGAVRARAMETARNEFVLCGDATSQLSKNFLEIALKWFSSEKIVAAFGRYVDHNQHGLIDRWRARHLFKQDAAHTVDPRGFLSTYGAIMRKSAVMRAGNYDPSLRHGEDWNLGLRLRTLGDVVADPALEVQPVIHNTLLEVMERYARWNRAVSKTFTLRDFFASHVVAWKILIPRDVSQRDWAAALISATIPYFSLFYADDRSLTFSRKSTPKNETSLQIKT